MKRPALNELSLTEKIAQILMLADEKIQYKPTENGAIIRPKEEIDEFFKKYQCGSYWHTGSIKMDIVNLAEEWADGRRMTLKESKEYIDDIQKNVRIPMLIATDAELGVGFLADGTPTPSQLSIGAANDYELAYNLAKGIARELRAGGINWRWAPPVDLHNRFTASIMRQYSDDPEVITKMATATIRGVESEHVASTIKHFPGGDGLSIRDGHFTSGAMLVSYEKWRENQGEIFQKMINEKPMSIMIGHHGFPAVDDTMIDGKYIPSSASRKIIQGLLRDEMGYEGVVITDAVEMAGLASLFPSLQELLIATINAGNDILLGVTPESFDLVYEAVEDGRIPMERIDESCERVLDLKEKIGLFDDEVQNEVFDVPAANKMVREISEEISEKSATLLYDRNNIIPVSKDKVKDVTIIYAAHSPSFKERLAVMKEEFEKRGAKANIYNGMPPGGIDEAAKSDLIIYVGHVAPHVPMGWPTLYGNQLSIFFRAFSKGKEKSIGLATGYPYLHYDIMAGAETFVNTYSASPDALKAFVKGIYGEIEFVGKSPVDIEPKERTIFG